MMRKPKYQNQLFLEDARNLREYFPNNKPVVDVIITSPPYWDMKNYGNKKGQIGFGQSKQEYLSDIKDILHASIAVTKKTGSLWLIADSFRRNGVLELLPLELAKIASEVGWKLREHITWDKQYSLPWHGRGQMRDVSESILFFTKTSNYKYYPNRIKVLDEISKWWVDFPERFNPKGKTPTNIWRYPIRRRGTWPNPSLVNHLCPFPTGLVARIIELTTNKNDLVLDPFAGSGVVLAQAQAMGRSFSGFELNSTYISMYKKEVKDEVLEEWVELKEQRKKFAKSRVNFEQTVLKLRALKYTRKVSQAFLNALPKGKKSNVKTIICWVDTPLVHKTGQPLKIEIWMVGEKNHRVFKRGLLAADKRMARVPLTHFEIDAKIFSGSIKDITKKFDVNIPFYLYPSQQPRNFTAKKPLADWVKRNQLELVQNGNGTPPMLANIAEDVSWALD